MGSLKKIFPSDTVTFEMQDITIREVLNYLTKHQSADIDNFDG